MSDRDPRRSVLRRLVHEARAEKPESVDFARVEERLLSEVRRAAPPAKRPSPKLAWGAVALAACATLWLVTGRGAPTAVPQSAPAPIAVVDPLQRDGDALAPGTRVTSAERSVSVTHAGRATWELAPGSSALLAERGERITVELERGSVRSEVVPSPRPETFVVLAAGARVAVHGTVFRVSLEGGRVQVQVREGVVAVGPRGAAPAFLLKAPASGEFSADGLTGHVDGPPSTGIHSSRGEPIKPGRVRAAPSVGATPSTSAASVSVELPKEPSIDDIESGIARSVDIASDCFRRHTQSAEGVQVTVRTALSLEIANSGAPTHVEFQPPLSPDAEICARDGISKITFAPSEQGAKVTRLLELKR